MINIQQNISNTVILTLTEKSSLLNPFYLFRMRYSSELDNEKYFTAADLSSYKSRYNQFNIIENSIEDLTGGTVALKSGMWDYFIYEQINPFNLDLSGTTGLVEVGKVIVEGEDLSIPLVYR